MLAFRMGPLKDGHESYVSTLTKQDPDEISTSSGSISENANAYVILSGLIASCSGLVYGYNIGISGGVTTTENFLQNFFPQVLKASQEANESSYCKYSDQTLQAFTSSLYLAGLISTIVASYVTKHAGRCTTMIVAGYLSLVGVGLTASSQHLGTLIFGRVLLGFAAGFTNQATPIYLSEIAPANLRGLLNAMFQMSLTLGIFIANMANFAVGYLDAHVGWRLALALAGLPSLMLAIGSLFLVESPVSLIERGKHAEGRANLQKVRGTQHVDEEFDDMVRMCNAVKATPNHPFCTLLKSNSRPQLIISIVIPFFQQMTGINAIMFYAPTLFQTVGFKSNASLYSTAIVGGVNLICTIASMFVIDRLGRKLLLIGGGLQMLVAQVAIATILGIALKDVSTNEVAELPHVYAIVVVALICIFVAGFGWSWGPITWLICSELHPLETRSIGQSITVFFNFMAMFTIAQAYLWMLCVMKYFIFIFFAIWLVVMTLFVLSFVPETKSIPLDAIQQVWKKHWFWKNIVDNVASNDLSISSKISGTLQTPTKIGGVSTTSAKESDLNSLLHCI